MDMVPRSRLNAAEKKLKESKEKLRFVQKGAGDEIFRLSEEVKRLREALAMREALAKGEK